MLPVLLLPASFHRIVKAINGAFPAVPSSALPRSKARISPWFGAELGLAHLGCSYTCFFPSLSDPCVLTAFRDLKTPSSLICAPGPPVMDASRATLLWAAVVVRHQRCTASSTPSPSLLLCAEENWAGKGGKVPFLGEPRPWVRSGQPQVQSRTVCDCHLELSAPLVTLGPFFLPPPSFWRYQELQI